MPVAPFIFQFEKTRAAQLRVRQGRHPEPKTALTKRRRAVKRAVSVQTTASDQEAAAFGGRLRELRWKNRAWLATAETMAGWNGFEIRKAGSGRSPVRKRSG